jgi:hypothetical protein
VKDTAEANFLSETQKQDAVVRRIEIIAEGAAHLSEETRREEMLNLFVNSRNRDFSLRWPRRRAVRVARLRSR